MKPVIRSAKHVKYVLGSMSAVLFTIVGETTSSRSARKTDAASLGAASAGTYLLWSSDVRDRR